MAASGIDIWRIQLHGRWGSSQVLRYVRLAPLASSLALEASLGRDLSQVRMAILDAKATLANLAPSTRLTDTDADLQQSLVETLGPTLSTPALFLGPPLVEEVLSSAAGKGWHRNPDSAELLVSNIGPPKFDRKLHSLRPPHKKWRQPLPEPEDLTAGTKIWCSTWDFVKAYGKHHAVFVVWDGGEECNLLPLCSRCFGKEELRQAAPASSSSSSDSE